MIRTGIECYQYALERVQSIVTMKLLDASLSNDTQKIIEQLLSHRLEKRLWLILSKESLSDLWGGIRREESFCDFLLEVTFALRCEFHEQEWKNLAKQMSEGFTCCEDNYDGNYNVIDEDMNGRLPEKEEFYRFLFCNPWFLVLNILNNTYLEILEQVSKELEE